MDHHREQDARAGRLRADALAAAAKTPWGELDTELREGRTFKLMPGMSYQVSDLGDAAHRSSTATGATLFIVDETRGVADLHRRIETWRDMPGHG
jgi:hypothetical protein